MCANNTAVVTWAATEGALAYNVTALGRDGDSKHCRTTNTTCDLPMMHCGQTYLITVTPFSETCSGFHSTAIAYTAGRQHLRTHTQHVRRLTFSTGKRVLEHSLTIFTLRVRFTE